MSSCTVTNSGIVRWIRKTSVIRQLIALHAGAIVAAIALHWWALTTMSEQALTGYSCAGRTPHTSQFFVNWLQAARKEL